MKNKISQNGQYGDDLSNVKRKVPIGSMIEMNQKEYLTTIDANNKNGIIVADSFSTVSESEKQETPTWFLRQKIFFTMICDNKLSSSIFLIGLLFAIFSGCSISLVIVFLGRIKHILLTNETSTISFLKRIYKEIIRLTFIIILSTLTHFGMHLSTAILSDKIRIRLKQRYDEVNSRKYFNDEIITNVIENIDLIEKGPETFTMQCRNVAIIISSLIICFYHEIHLSLIVSSIASLIIIMSILSRALSKKSNILLSNKISQTIQMEKELLLLKTNFANDECLMKLSSEMRNCTRYAILHQVWKSSHSGILSFTIFTIIGCGMLYGGYLLNMNPMIKKGDIFITVLSMALIVGSISTIITYYYFIKKIIHAALYIRSLQQFDYQYTLIQYGSRHCSTDEVIVTLITAPEFKMPVIPPRGNSIIRFINGTRNVLRNYHNHKLFLLIGFILAIIYGFEYAVYNMLMGQIFKTMLDDTPNIHILTLCAIQLSATGFAVFILRIASTILAAVVSEHMAVSFRVILSRHLLKIADKESFSKLNINTLVDENVSLTSEAKSLYHPYLSELLTRISSMITNIILGFIYSWEITLLGIILIILCLTVQMKMEFEGFNYCCKCTSNQRIQKKTKPLKSYESSMFRAINFSIIQTFGFALKAICYALTAFICYHKYKQQTQAFVSVITLFSASREAVQLPELIRKLYKSWRAVNRIVAY
ncbi:Multidrug resistance protein [Dirofilaria immitis]